MDGLFVPIPTLPIKAAVDPVWYNEPVTCCTLLREEPIILLPVVNKTEEVTVCTTRVCAVKVP